MYRKAITDGYYPTGYFSQEEPMDENCSRSGAGGGLSLLAVAAWTKSFLAEPFDGTPSLKKIFNKPANIYVT